MRDSVIKKVMSAITSITDIHNKQVAPLLTEHHKDIASSKEDIKALYELVEMYFFVITKAMATGLFDPDENGERKNIVAIMSEMDKMQDHYLSCVSIVSFFSQMKHLEDLE